MHHRSTFRPHCDVLASQPTLCHRQSRTAHQPWSVRQPMGVPELYENVLDNKAELCQTHATSIAANNRTHGKYFQDDEKYEKFYEMLCDIMPITCEPSGYYLHSLLVQWLRANVDDLCADWFETHWTGPVKGRYLLGSSGVGLVSNNQSLISCWRWDSHACTSGSQVIS